MLDLLLVLLQYTLAVKFLGRSDEAVLWGPLLVGKDDTIDDLNTIQATLLTSGLQVLENDLVKLLVVTEVFKTRAFNAVLRGELLESGLSGNNDCDGLVLILSGVDADVADKGN